MTNTGQQKKIARLNTEITILQEHLKFTTIIGLRTCIQQMIEAKQRSIELIIQKLQQKQATRSTKLSEPYQKRT